MCHLTKLCLWILFRTLDASWVQNVTLKAAVMGDDVYTKPAPRVTLNLDLDPKERWREIASNYKSEAYKITDYLKSQLPPWAFPIVVQIAADIEPYFTDYGDEMVGLADALGLPLGEIVATNLVYQLERIGVNCSNWNNTGPTLDDDAIPHGLSCEDTMKWWDQSRRHLSSGGPHGRCTSIVSQDAAGSVSHGRNLDWNIPDSLKDFIVDVDVYRDENLVFTGTTAVGFVGFLNGLRYAEGSDSGAWSLSMDARNHGGRIPFNLAEALWKHSLTPEQALRKALEGGLSESSGSFDSALTALADVPIVDDVYYVMAGGGPDDELAVITRARNAARDVWRLDPETAQVEGAWFLTETNYDHWKAVPAADNRRDPANTYMLGLGSNDGTNLDTMFSQVMSQWPVFNAHTTFTTMMHPQTGVYNSSIWYGNFNSP